MRRKNRILMTDSYKMSHPGQYPKGSKTVYSYYESRGGMHVHIFVFGNTYYVKKYFEGIQIEQWMIDDADRFVTKHMGPGLFNREDWQYILDTYGGYLPLEIKAAPEGSVIPGKNVLLTIHNTDPKVPFLTNWAETVLSRLWAPYTVASNSWEIRNYLKSKLEEAGDSLEGLDFMLHDFGARGVSSGESSEILGMAHLATGFKGSDNMEAIEAVYYFYNEEMAAISVAASEHSTVTSWGKEHEDDAIENMFNIYPTGIVSFVADSYDVFDFTERMGTKFKHRILEHDGITVIRPDSGDPRIILPKLLDSLWKNFHGQYTERGYKVLNPKIRILQGDGIDKESIIEIIDVIMDAGYAPSNLIFGSGGGLLQKFDRDTDKFAIKCSALEIEDPHGKGTIWRDVFKDPITSKMKKSKKGRMVLHKTGSDYMTITHSENEMYDQYHDELQLIFRNGVLYNEVDLLGVRERAEKTLAPVLAF